MKLYSEINNKSVPSILSKSLLANVDKDIKEVIEHVVSETAFVTGKHNDWHKSYLRQFRCCLDASEWHADCDRFSDSWNVIRGELNLNDSGG